MGTLESWVTDQDEVPGRGTNTVSWGVDGVQTEVTKIYVTPDTTEGEETSRVYHLVPSHKLHSNGRPPPVLSTPIHGGGSKTSYLHGSRSLCTESVSHYGSPWHQRRLWSLSISMVTSQGRTLSVSKRWGWVLSLSYSPEVVSTPPPGFGTLVPMCLGTPGSGTGHLDTSVLETESPLTSRLVVQFLLIRPR